MEIGVFGFYLGRWAGGTGTQQMEYKWAFYVFFGSLNGLYFRILSRVNGAVWASKGWKRYTQSGIFEKGINIAYRPRAEAV
mgnify:CR=1 FL=1